MPLLGALSERLRFAGRNGAAAQPSSGGADCVVAVSAVLLSPREWLQHEPSPSTIRKYTVQAYDLVDFIAALWRRTPGCPVVGGAGAVREADCPVVTPDFDPRNFMPRASNDPATGQRAPLGQDRVASSIPIGARRWTEQLPVELLSLFASWLPVLGRRPVRAVGGE